MEQETADNSGGGFAPTPMTDILTPRADAAPPPEAAPAPAPEATGDTPAPTTDERPRDPVTGKFAPKDAQADAAPPAAKQDAPQAVPVQAVLEERKKRQALERELQELRAKLAAPAPAPQQPQQPASQPVPLTDLMFQDPERFVQTLRQQQEEALIQTRLATSEAIARQQPDYDAAEQALTAYAQSSPQAAQEVAQALRQHPAPAMWAYQAGKQLLSQQRWAPLMQQHSDPEAWINAEVERRLAERAPAPAPSSAPLPQSLASARAAGPRNPAPAYRGPTPMSAILGRR